MKKKMEMEVIHPHAAGIDIGAKTHWVAIGQDPQTQVFSFGVYTEDHHKIIDLLRQAGITSVAMESTGTYWQTLFAALQSAGFDVLLTNSRHLQNSGGKSDVKDCRWLQKLHSLGLLKGSFLPSEQTMALRHYHRHRESLQESASAAILRMQKAMQQMNVRLEVALRDITGKSGRAIIEAIIAGERNSMVLAGLAHRNVKKSREEIARSLEGNWKPELLYILADEYGLYQHYQHRIAECDRQIGELLSGIAGLESEKRSGPDDPAPDLVRKVRQKNQCNIDVSRLSYRYTGVDLMAIEGVSFQTVMTFIAEVGADIYKFASARSFAQWLRLTPNQSFSGGKLVRHGRVPSGKNRLALALRNAANTIAQRKEGALKQFFSRIAFKKGRAAAITATARKLAVIIWNMVVKKQTYQPVPPGDYSERVRKNTLSRLKKMMQRHDIRLEELFRS